MEKDRWDLTCEIAFQEKKLTIVTLFSILLFIDPLWMFCLKFLRQERWNILQRFLKVKVFLTKMIEWAISSNHSDGKSEIRLDFFSRSSAKYFEVEPSRMLFWCNYKIFLVVFVAGWSHVALSIKHPLTEKRYIF